MMAFKSVDSICLIQKAFSFSFWNKIADEGSRKPRHGSLGAGWVAAGSLGGEDEGAAPVFPPWFQQSALTFICFRHWNSMLGFIWKTDSTALLLKFDNSDLDFLQYWQFFLNATK